MKFLGSLWLVAGAIAGALASPTNNTQAPTNNTEGAENTYEYIVIGSGAGGGPLAARLARANHSVLLIEAGDDRGGDYNYSVPGFQAAVTEDKNIAWNIFVNHYPNDTQAQRDPKYVYATPDGGEYVGLDPPAGSTPKGVLYPRAGTLGGCVSHNALIWILPQAIDWNTIWQITDDQGWSQNEMLQHLGAVAEWLTTEATDPTIVIRDLQLLQHFAGAAATMGLGPDPLDAVTGLAQLLLADPNIGLNRDEAQGFFQVPLIMKNGARDGVRERIVDTIQQGYPLTLRTNSFVTKINFDESGDTPVATGVEYEDGQWLYQASPLNTGAKGTPGSAKATKEVIVAGGTYNTVQLLKLSGIGPQEELQQHGIKVVKNLPGVGKNLQDRYEVPVNVLHPNDFPILDGCTFDAKPHDECYKQWVNNPYILAQKGAYATNGLAATMAVNSEYADDKNIDLYIFGGPVNFTGYFPGWAQKAIESHKYYSWYTLKAHTRNTAGTVELRSTNPFEQPEVNFNYFEYGTTENDADLKDLNSLVQAVNISRHALAEYSNYPILLGSNFTEVSPGPDIQSTEDLQQYVKDVAWGHHACCTAKIGAGNDPDTVLDSKFRVQGVQGLRVVDASIFPKIPGIFIQAPILIASEKAAYDILNGN